MKTGPRQSSFIAGLPLLLAACAGLAADKPAQAPVPAVLEAMQDEIGRSMAALSKSDPPAYFISYTIADRQFSEVSGSNGALLSTSENRARWLEVQSHVGSYQLDNTHKLGDRPPSWTSPGSTSTIDDDISVLRREIWRRWRQIRV